MRNTLKPLNRQVIVITGACFGIGLATARVAAKAGARLVMAARNEQALGLFFEESGREGGSAVVVDVADGASAVTRGGRRAHLSGRGAARWMAWSNALLAKPAEISKLDVIGKKLG